MSYRVQCEKDLAISGCRYEARGETPGDVIEQVTRHLRAEHKVKLPDPQEILEGDTAPGPLGEEVDRGTSLIVRRLREALDLEGTAPGAGTGPRPAIGRTTNE